MKPASPAKTRPANRKVTAENLAKMGAERLATLLVDVAATRPDLKRRLRMELAAEQGAGPLANEIDRRLSTIETSRGRVGWRNKPAFLRDLQALRDLIAERLAPLDAAAAIERLERYLMAARQIGARLREREDLDPVFAAAAGDLGRLTAGMDPRQLAARLAQALATDPLGWSNWIDAFLAQASPETAAETLALVRDRQALGWTGLIRRLAQAGLEAQAYGATFTAQALAMPAVAAQLGRLYLRAGQVEAAGEALRRAAPKPRRWSSDLPDPDFDWESAWIDYLEAAGDAQAAQTARWASFERTLSVERARSFIRRLADFDDVEAEERAFAFASKDADFERGLRFLMDWPSLGQAARMIEARADDIQVDAPSAELWAAKLRARWPGAALVLLRRAAGLAFKRRDFAASERLTQEAESIQVP
ncbi:MAG: hypothetical protein JWM33_422 [Caulobacteraceae bacterium]|nr:hypothetical protein [Caulobacteraceae bacterium]